MTSREQIELDARELFAALDLSWESKGDKPALLDRLRSAYGIARPPAPRRELASLRMALDSVGQEVENESFTGAAVSSIRGDDNEVNAVALAAWGWRAQWLVGIMKLLNTAVDKSLGDLKQSNSDILAKAALESFKHKKPL